MHTHHSSDKTISNTNSANDIILTLKTLLFNTTALMFEKNSKINALVSKQTFMKQKAFDYLDVFTILTGYSSLSVRMQPHDSREKYYYISIPLEQFTRQVLNKMEETLYNNFKYIVDLLNQIDYPAITEGTWRTSLEGGIYFCPHSSIDITEWTNYTLETSLKDHIIVFCAKTSVNFDITPFTSTLITASLPAGTGFNVLNQPLLYWLTPSPLHLLLLAVSQHVMPNELKTVCYQLELNKRQKPIEIGSGSFGTVYKGLSKGKAVAIKRSTTNSIHNIDSFKQEIRMFNMLAIEKANPDGSGQNINAHIITMYGYKYQRGCIDLVFEFAPGGSLDKHVYQYHNPLPLPTELRYSWAYQIASGLQCMHACNIIYRDLKLENVLLFENNIVKLADLGLACFIEESLLGDYAVGSPLYWAPEVITYGAEQQTQASDVYTYGILAWELTTRNQFGLNTTGNIPLTNIDDLEKHIVNQQQRPAFPADCPERAIQLIQRCWHTKPKKRPYSEEIVKELSTENTSFSL